VTGHHDYFEQVERSGYRFLFKPFRIGTLLETINEVLRESKIRCKAKTRTHGS
jgi:hypothetical protein